MEQNRSNESIAVFDSAVRAERLVRLIRDDLATVPESAGEAGTKLPQDVGMAEAVLAIAEHKHVVFEGRRWGRCDRALLEKGAGVDPAFSRDLLPLLPLLIFAYLLLRLAVPHCSHCLGSPVRGSLGSIA